MFTGVESGLISAFESYRPLLTAYSYVQDVTSPSLASATASLSAAASVVSSLPYVLTEITYVISALPSLSCDESVVEYYATAYPSAASYIWDVLDGETYVATSSASSFASFEAQYYTLYSAEYSIVGGLIDYSFLYSLESSFIYAAESDSSLLTQYETLSYTIYAVSYSYSELPTLEC